LVTRRNTPERNLPTLLPEKGLQVLEKQLQELQKFKTRHHEDAQHDEQSWSEMTRRFMDMAFGSPNDHSKSLGYARSAGEYYMRPDFGGYRGPDPQDQVNFQTRVTAYEGSVNNALTELRLMLPEPETKGIYEPGDEYAFYRDLKGVLGAAKKEVFLIDNYLSLEIFDLYANLIQPGVLVRMLTDQPKTNLVAVARKYAGRGNFELRGSADVHDRVVFVDGRCWVIGQSIKDAAKKKPTYMIEHENPGRMQPVYESIWTQGETLAKG
jgi:hypothetical protein